MDKQLVEVIGRNKLIEQLLRAGLEVAVPVRDHGIDLIAYFDRKSFRRSFVGRPIQIKASAAEQFSIEQKYERFPNLILAFVWHVPDSSQAVIFALTYKEARRIGNTIGWTRTRSWRQGKYTTQRPSKRLKRLLLHYKMTSKLWRSKLLEGIQRKKGKQRGRKYSPLGLKPRQRSVRPA